MNKKTAGENMLQRECKREENTTKNDVGDVVNKRRTRAQVAIFFFLNNNNDDE